jgi:methyl-accepting chemotaxis protein
MRSIRIAHTIYLLLGVALFAGGVASVYLTVRCAHVSRDYSNIIFGEEQQAQRVRELQVSFKKQVQAWKDILLRGRDDAALQKYSAEFHAQAEAVDGGAKRLAAAVKDDQAHAGLMEFASQHEQLDQEYEKAFAGYRANRDFAAADAAVKGKDRQPTDSLDGVAERLAKLAEEAPSAEAARLRSEQAVMTCILLLLWTALAAWSIVFARSLGLRMNRSVEFVRQIAQGDLTVVEPEQGGQDELGQLIEAMSGMRDQLRVVVGGIQEVSGALTSGADAVARSSSQIAKATTEQRGESAQVASALEQMIATVREVAEHCQQASTHAEKTGELAHKSSGSVEGVAEEVRVLAEGAAENARAVHELGERTRQIGQIVDLISEIAGQTNLLALNAAIESSRAGEHGKGFAVVAGEVRRLAERTTAATQEITTAVHSIQNETQVVVKSIRETSERVERSVEVADAAAQSLQKVGESASEVRERIRQIAQSAEEQSHSSALVGRSMQEMASSIASSSEGAEESARTAEEMATMAQQLEVQSGHFKTGEEKSGMPQMNKRHAA